MISTLRACSVFGLTVIAAAALASCGRADKVQAKAPGEFSAGEVSVGVVKVQRKSLGRTLTVSLGSNINTMILGGMALAFSRVIDNSVISLENIYRHLEMGTAAVLAAERGGSEVSLAVLAATLPRCA
jgi:AcrB/AcrD/AcrF family